MNIYTFKSMGMLGQMYVGGEEVEMGGSDFYLVADVARERAEYASKLSAAGALMAANADLAMWRARAESAQSRLDNALAWYKLAAEQRDTLVGRLGRLPDLLHELNSYFESSLLNKDTDLYELFKACRGEPYSARIVERQEPK